MLWMVAVVERSGIVGRRYCVQLQRLLHQSKDHGTADVLPHGSPVASRQDGKKQKKRARLISDVESVGDASVC